MPSVEKRPPTPAVAPETAEPLPKFEEFAEKMKPHVKDVRKNDLPPLLRKLYKEAQQKLKLEKSRKQAQEDKFMLRGSRHSMEEVSKKLGQALKILEEAKQENGEQLTQIEESLAWRMTPFTFDKVIQHFKDGMEVAEEIRGISAEIVHPDLRNPGERKLVQKFGKGNSPGAMKLQDYPARKLSKEIDHWFIGAAEDCLKEHEEASGKKIPRHDKIISHLFEVCFSDTRRDYENIRAELGRQKKKGRPRYTTDIWL